MKASYKNLLDTATLTPLSEFTGNPADNLKNQLLTKKWFSTTADDQTLVVDLGSAQLIDCVSIISHNLINTATVTVEANATDSWGAPSYSTELEWNEGVIFKFLSQTFRYWRFVFENLDDGLEIGRIWLGADSFTFLQGSTMDAKPSLLRSDTVSYGKGRQKYASVGLNWRRLELDFPPTKSVTLMHIFAMYDYAGNHSAILFFMLDTTRGYPLFEPLYCSISGNGLKFTHDLFLKQKYSLTLEECL